MTTGLESRYHRQTLLPMIGPAGQQAISAAHVLIIGCGALGSASAELLCRAGVGHLRLVDRDIVEASNLQRQLLYDESDAIAQTPKPIAAARRLSQINSQIVIEPICADACPNNINSLLTWNDGQVATVILDGTDNVQTRYLINDISVQKNIPWVYGACVGVEGRVMAIHSGLDAGIGTGPCLRCIFPTPPQASDLPACDTAGVLGPAATTVAALQAAATIRIITQLMGTSLISIPAAECASPKEKTGTAPDSKTQLKSQLKGPGPFSSHPPAAKTEKSYVPLNHQAESELKGTVPFNLNGVSHLFALNLWTGHMQNISVERDPDCPCCGQHQYPFLNEARRPTVNLCGRSAVQVWPAHQSLNLKAVAARLADAGQITTSPFFIRFSPAGSDDIQMTIFPDGRALVAGTTDTGRAMSLYSRYVGQ